MDWMLEVVGVPAGRGAVALEEVAEAVVACIRDDSLAGRVMVLWPGEPCRLLDPDRRE